MRVVCDRRDQDLLFLSHGVVRGVRGFLTSLHVRRCSSCQQRVNDFNESSRQLRLAFGGSPVMLATPQRLSRLGLAAVLALLLAALGVGAYYTIPPADE